MSADTTTRPIGRPRIGERFAVRLPDDVRAGVKEAAAFYALNESEYVRLAVERELERTRARIRREGGPR